MHSSAKRGAGKAVDNAAAMARHIAFILLFYFLHVALDPFHYCGTWLVVNLPMYPAFANNIGKALLKLCPNGKSP